MLSQPLLSNPLPLNDFLAPERLWLLLGLPVLAAFYLWRQRRRRSYALRFTSVALLGQVAPRRPAWRRHVAALGLLLSLALLVLAFARPAGEVEVPRERATIIVTIDVSLSMEAEDVEPNRLRAAQTAATDFVATLPPRLNVGLVAFAGTAQVLVPPTTDRALVGRAIDDLELREYTAVGEAIFTSLAAIEAVPEDPSAPDEPVPARVVLLSDGETTVGRPNADGIDAARAAGVPIYTIAFGTLQGTVELGGIDQPVPVEVEDLRRISERTGGVAYRAETAGELEDVYDDIGSSVGFELRQQEVTDRWVGAALVALLLSAFGSLAWFGRLP
ncbi:MAG TPA: VWA domain-containing protein [Actinomycetales bacterium]|nr:VWA domain-containing protein [Actinomycetales bacterium]